MVNLLFKSHFSDYDNFYPEVSLDLIFPNSAYNY